VNNRAIDRTSYLSPHLRFGYNQYRGKVSEASYKQNTVFLSELVWREFFYGRYCFIINHVLNREFQGRLTINLYGLMMKKNSTDGAGEKPCNPIVMQE
jgi:deoxyribodipyrimidine photolyase